ncbi:MAG: putative dsRNA-binding protein [Deinococcales bacterium]
MMHPKGVLIERCQALGLTKPEFDTKRSGPEHEPTFITDVLLDGEVYGTGQGTSKREAEKNASSEALLRLEQTPQNPTLPNQRTISMAPLEFEERFEGPWPMFSELLSNCLSIANSRVDNRLKGEKAISEVHDLALNLYKKSLESLGEVIELDETEL